MIRVVFCVAAMMLSYYLTGALIIDKKRGTPAILLGGFLAQLAVFEVLTLISIVAGFSMQIYGTIMLVAMVAICMAAMLKYKNELGSPADDFCDRLLSSAKRAVTFKLSPEDFLMLFAILLVALQTAALVAGIHTDDDDSFYVATATTAIDTNTMYEYSPYTGALYDELPARYILSPWSMYGAFWAFVMGMRPAVVFHTAFPAVLIPMAYISMYLLGRAIWKDDAHSRIKSYGFIVALSFLHVFSAFSTWSMGMRLLIRVWQGKIVLASVILPVIFTLMLKDWESERVSRPMLFYVFVTMTAACFVSSMGILLAPLTLGCLALTRIILKREIKYELMLIPGVGIDVILGLIYMGIK